jgi:hypothetical protein
MAQQQLGFHKATKKASRLRLALVGPSGSGKTYTALQIASNLGKRIAVVDTERGSASKYSDIFDFDSVEPERFGPLDYVNLIHMAEQAGYDVLIIDSLSHAWTGIGGALEMVENSSKRGQGGGGNSFTAWRDVTPQHNEMVDAIVSARLHVIATMRVKTEYTMESVNGKMVPRKVGLAPIQRAGIEYEMDVVCDMDQDNNIIVSKTRCPALNGQVFHKRGDQVARILSDWLGGSEQINLFKQEEVSSNGSGRQLLEPDNVHNPVEDLSFLRDSYVKWLNIANEEGVLNRKGEPFIGLSVRWSKDQLEKGIALISGAVEAAREARKEEKYIPEDEPDGDSGELSEEEDHESDAYGDTSDNSPDQSEPEQPAEEEKIVAKDTLTEAQRGAILAIANKVWGRDVSQEQLGNLIIKLTGHPIYLESLSKGQASSIIDALRNMLPVQTPTQGHQRPTQTYSEVARDEPREGPEPVTKDQVTKIKTMIGKMARDNDAGSLRITQESYYRGSTLDLTKYQAMEIIDRMEKDLEAKEEQDRLAFRDAQEAAQKPKRAKSKTEEKVASAINDTFMEALAGYGVEHGFEPTFEPLVASVNNWLLHAGEKDKVKSAMELSDDQKTRFLRAVKNGVVKI